MAHDKQELLEALKFELLFLQRGGYEPSVRARQRELTVFRDSPSCLNFASEVREHPCSECWLMDFVPAEKQGEGIPCHYIPFNERGDTVANVSPLHSANLKEAMENWLRNTIARLEAELAVDNKAAPMMDAT